VTRLRRTLALVVAAGILTVLAGRHDPQPSVSGTGPAADGIAAPSPGPTASVPGVAPLPPSAAASVSERPTAPVAVDVPVSAPDGDGAGGPSEDDGAAAVPVGPRPEERFVVATGGAAAGSGRLLRYTVEVEAATGLDPDAVAAEVDAALGDPRSWARVRRLERVDDVSLADARVVVATPGTVDALCARVGLNTAGVFSCWTGTVAALNSWRWEVGAPWFEDITSYRTYLVNHEVGHALGHGHRRCSEPGAPAPVMMQQSKGLDGCVANGWPYP
jgi:hypothetical protein